MRKLFFIGKTFVLGTGVAAILILSAMKLGWHRPYINWLPWDLAEYLVKYQRPASECFDLIWFGIMSPTQAEQRALCVYEYAKMKKDPSACELIMPSSYGLSCVGGAENHSLPCNTEIAPYSVYWRDDAVEHTVQIRECIKSDPHRTALGNQCCAIAKVAFLNNHDDCSILKNTPITYDRCKYALAWKLRNPHFCTDISDANARTACKVQTAAFQKDPSICYECTPPIDLNDIEL